MVIVQPCNMHGRIVEIVKNDFALPSEIEDKTEQLYLIPYVDYIEGG